RALTHLQRVGHFEFGLDRRPINAGNSDEVAHIIDLWQHGAEVEGWARYWAYLHDHLAERLSTDPQLRSAVMLVGYEDFCRTPLEGVVGLFAHCGLKAGETLLNETAAMVRPPALQRPPLFSDEDLVTIERCTAESARRLGFGAYSAAS
ncbi:MAG: sulfotransferase, partial [Deltaproteobacteria bacterium]